MLSREENARLNIKEMREGKLVLRSFPRIASIGLTLRCNLNCIMCFTQKMKKIDMDDAVLKNASQLFPYLEEARWNDAGELLASRNSERYLQLINELRIPRSYVSSNFKAARPMMDKIVAGGLTHLSVSMDAARAETYKRIRRGGDFQVVLDNLLLMKKMKEERNQDIPHLTLVFIAMKSNVQELPEFVDLAHQTGAEEIHVLKLLPNPAQVDVEQAITLEELQPHYKAASKKAMAYGIRLSHIAYTDQELLGIEENSSAKSELHPLPDRRCHFNFRGYPFCRSPWTEILIDVHGKVRPCCYHPIVLGDLTKDSVLDIWNNEAYQEFRRKIRDHDFAQCHHCSWQHKVFNYRVPPSQEEGELPINRRFEILEKGWDLKRDLVIRHQPFSEFKISLDDKAFRMNKEWDLGTAIPAVDYGSATEKFIESLQQPLITDEPTDPTTGLPTHEPLTAKAWLKNILKRALSKLLRFHLQQQHHTLQRLEQKVRQSLSLMASQQRQMIQSLALYGRLFDNQKAMNALLVQYLNQFSDGVFDRFERQQNINMEFLHLARQTNERIDRIRADQELMFKILAQREAAGDSADSPLNLDKDGSSHYLNTLLLNAALHSADPPRVVPCGLTIEMPITITNNSRVAWGNSASGRNVRLVYHWQQVKTPANGHNTIAPHIFDFQGQWISTFLQPGESVSITLAMICPRIPGSYRVFISLLTEDERLFCKWGQGLLTFSCNVEE